MKYWFWKFVNLLFLLLFSLIRTWMFIKEILRFTIWWNVWPTSYTVPNTAGNLLRSDFLMDMSEVSKTWQPRISGRDFVRNYYLNKVIEAGCRPNSGTKFKLFFRDCQNNYFVELLLKFTFCWKFTY